MRTTYWIIICFSLLFVNKNVGQSIVDLEILRSEYNSSKSISSKFRSSLKLAEYFMYNNNDSCDYYLSVSKELSTNLDESSIKGDYFLVASRVEKLRSHFNTAQDYALKAGNYYSSGGNISGYIDVNNVLGDIFALKGDFDKSLSYFEETLKLSDENQLPTKKIKALIGMANIYYYTDQFDLAKESFEKAIDLSEKFDFIEDRTSASLYTNYGNLNLTQGEYLKAINFYYKAFQLYGKLNDKYRLSLVAYNLGDAYLGINEYDSSLKYFNVNLFLGQELKNLEEIKYAYKGLTNLYEQKRDFENALGFYYKYVAYADSTSDQQYNAQLEVLTKQFEENEKLKIAEEELAHSEEIQEKQKELNYILTIGFLIIVIAVIIVLFLYFNSIKTRKLLESKNQEIEEKNLKIDKTLQQKEILLQEVHHRVKNNLQLIASLLNLQLSNLENDTAIRAIEESRSRVQAIALMHKGLYQNDNYNSVDLSTYVNELVDNLRTISSSTEREILFKVDVAQIKLSIDQSVPIGLILSELISNSLKHAFKNTSSGEIDIQFKLDGDKIIMNYGDNGCGLPDNFNIEEQDTLGFTVISALSDQIGGALTFVSYSPIQLELRF